MRQELKERIAAGIHQGAVEPDVRRAELLVAQRRIPLRHP